MNNGLIAWIGSFILGLGVVWKAVEKFSPKIKKYIKISAKAVDLLDAVVTAIEDKKVDSVEVEKIREEVNELMEALK